MGKSRPKAKRKRAPLGSSASGGRARGKGAIEFKREFAATAEAADRAQKALVRKLVAGRCAVGDVLELRTALREGVNNAIRHASKLDPSKQVTLEARFAPHAGLHIVIRDQGWGFDPGAVPDPTKPENLEKFSGRGLYMMRRIMDRMEYRAGGRELHLWRRPRRLRSH